MAIVFVGEPEVRKVSPPKSYFGLPKCLVVVALLTVCSVMWLQRPSFRAPFLSPSEISKFSLVINEQSDPCSSTHLRDLELFLPTPPTDEGISELTQFILPTLSLFWPRADLRLAFVTDQESSSLEKFNKQLATHTNSTRITSNTRVVLNSNPMTLPGWHRQQWLMFWADNFTSAKFVGFIDTDTFFVTKVTPFDLFVGEQPIIRPLYGMPHDTGWWPYIPRSTFYAIGLKEPFSCMTYFPVIIKTDHLKPMREHIRKHLGTATFDEAFWKLMKSYQYSQFGIMCAYLWYFQRESYYWSINQRSSAWFGPAPEGQIATLEEGGINRRLLQYRPHVAIHWNYETFKNAPNATRIVMRNGVCYSMPERETGRPSFCYNNILIGNRSLTINPYEWIFEGWDLSWNKAVALDAHVERIKVTDACPHDWNRQLISELE